MLTDKPLHLKPSLRNFLHLIEKLLILPELFKTAHFGQCAKTLFPLIN